ncbi:MAG TPA: DUF4179 domain-containing protein [Bacillus bacterium]|uniref:DUF4179 domain-containing protein n=1 Tax=Siminovitchia fordii TaxID=254759 RepID=A0ABQ4K9E1_9BACI|nr:DUF4179 domain-containing protein [Siminovitchia fordii]GIN22332.1 hypothetical protein J1TS3_34660 [Siminovitchia fordii]HBZ11834.1 DUF4179 domain-containing protein [Bacillus sp. (in: firmicutes)]
MNDIEKQLNEEKRRLSSITAPEELESRLRSALQTTPKKRPRRTSVFMKLAAVALVLIVAAGYQYNALAYYGKKLLGFDEIINSTLQDLNNKGLGQTIEKKATLIDGTVLTIDGIMTDSNQMIMYYTLSNPKGLDEETIDRFQPLKITGFLTRSNFESSIYMSNNENTEIKGTLYFEPVSPFSKKLTFHYWESVESGTMKDESITFSYDPNKAMQTELKQKIYKNVRVDKGTISFKSITASPTLTVIDGKLNVGNFDRVPSALDGIELVANGVPVDTIGSGHRSAINGMKFDLRFDALPKKLDSLELVVKEFAGYKKLEEKIKLTSQKNFTVGGKDLIIQNVALTSEGTEITIATDEDIMLDGVSIETKSGEIPLLTTVNQVDSENEDGRTMKERTLLFDTKDKPELLLIEGMHYLKDYNKKIKIPVK